MTGRRVWEERLAVPVVGGQVPGGSSAPAGVPVEDVLADDTDRLTTSAGQAARLVQALVIAANHPATRGLPDTPDLARILLHGILKDPQ